MPKKKKILMVSMPSLHFFRWVDQLKDSDFEVYWFDITGAGKSIERISWVHQITNWKMKWDVPGRIFIKSKFPNLYRCLQKINERSIASEFDKTLTKIQPDLVHSFALQHGCLPIFNSMIGNDILWLFSTWGSDIYYQNNKINFEENLKKVLSRVNFLITDCKRDYSIAKVKGFCGEFLGVFPGGGGFFLDEIQPMPFNERKIILIKGYDNKLGKAINVLKALAFFKKEIIDYNVIIFGASPAVKSYCSENEFWIKKARVYGFIPHSELIKLMSKAKLYIGNSLSDGMPNTLLEAICYGAFPIQSNPGNATSEIIKDGFNGLLIQDAKNVDNIKQVLHQYFLLDDINEGLNYNFSNLRKNYEREMIKLRVISKYKEILYGN